MYGLCRLSIYQLCRVGCFILFGSLAAFQVSAFSGGVTTYNKPNSDTVQKKTTLKASAGPEHDATYQRTMRKNQTAAAAARAAKVIIKNIAGVGTVIALAELAQELNGIWQKDSSGNNSLMVLPKGVCSVAPCYQYQVNDVLTKQSWSNTREQACQVFGAAWQATHGETMVFQYLQDGGATCRYIRGYGGPMLMPITAKTVEPAPQPSRQTIDDVELEDKLKAWPGLPAFLDEVDDKGIEIPWSEDEVEDMPQPLVLSPRITTHPDGSKTIEQTTLTPERGPDGKTINWNRKTETTKISAPDATGNTTSEKTTTDTKTGQAKQEVDNRSECEKSPKALGCAELDTPDEKIPKVDKNITYSAESHFGGGSCPTNKTLNIKGTQVLVYDWATSCSYITSYFRPLLLAICAFAALMILAPAVKT